MAAGGPGEAAAGVVGSPTFGWINREKQLDSEIDHTTQVSSKGNKASNPLAEKNLWGLRQREKLPASGKTSLERPTGS